MAQLTYKDAGVDFGLYAEAMDKLPALMRRTQSARASSIWSADLPDCFASTMPTGPGAAATRIRSSSRARTAPAQRSNSPASPARFDTIGIDLVAMCVNDVLCLGAEPLFFLDYIAMDRDDPQRLAALVKGVSDGCIEARDGPARRRNGHHAGALWAGRLRYGRLLRRRGRSARRSSTARPFGPGTN